MIWSAFEHFRMSRMSFTHNFSLVWPDASEVPAPFRLRWLWAAIARVQKIIATKTTTFSESPGRQLSDGIPWIPQKIFPIWEKSVCVCIVLVHNGPFPQKINGKSVNLAVWAVSVIFLFDFTLFVIDIHHIMLISLFPTPFDHFHFHPTLGLDPALILTLRHKGKMRYFWTIGLELVVTGVACQALKGNCSLWDWEPQLA